MKSSAIAILLPMISLAHGDLSVMVGTIGIDDIIVASATSAEDMTVDPHDAAATASDDQVEDR